MEDFPVLKKLRGPQTLNGPILEGFACPVRVYVGPGVVMGCEVMILASSQELAEGIAATLSYQKPGESFHCLIGQPPWYENKTKANTLDDVLSPPTPKRKRGSLL